MLLLAGTAAAQPTPETIGRHLAGFLCSEQNFFEDAVSLPDDWVEVFDTHDPVTGEITAGTVHYVFTKSSGSSRCDRRGLTPMGVGLCAHAPVHRTGNVLRLGDWIPCR